MSEFAYGLDFGTSKTALTRAKCDGPSPAVTDIEVDENRHLCRTSTVLLLEKATGHTFAIGTPAEEQWMLSSDEERQAYTFYANFKPHITSDPDAKDKARLFLEALYHEESVSREFSLPAERVTVVGRPSQWDEKAEDLLVGLVREVGFPKPRCLPEPVGALFYHLATNLRAVDVVKNILVIDWGAGTCDFTLMSKCRPSKDDTWGSNLYGGRLFDDLFYQWLIDDVRRQGKYVADLEEVLGQDDLDRYVHAVRARELKEEFSNWSRRPRSRFVSKPIFVSNFVSKGIQHYSLGSLVVEQYADFEARARKYVPTDTMYERVVNLGGSAGRADEPFLNRLLHREPIDLLSWGEALLRPVRPEIGIEVIILTGGSTLWPWFDRIVRNHEIYKRNKFIVFTDQNPELTIARGLSRAQAIGEHARGMLRMLEGMRDEIVRQLNEQFLQQEIGALAERIMEHFMADRFEKEVMPIIERSRKPIMAVFAWGVNLEAEKKELTEVFRDWFKKDGCTFIQRDLEDINGRAGPYLIELSKKQGLCWGGLLDLTMQACSPPLDHSDWEEYLSKINLGGELSKEFDIFISRSFSDTIVEIILGVIFGIIFIFPATLMAAFDKDIRKDIVDEFIEIKHYLQYYFNPTDQQLQREEAERAAAARRKIHEKFRSELSSKISEYPLMKSWSIYTYEHLMGMIEKVFEITSA